LAPSAGRGIAITAMAGIGELGKVSANSFNHADP
jgi:hypothetical protein